MMNTVSTQNRTESLVDYYENTRSWLRLPFWEGPCRRSGKRPGPGAAARFRRNRRTPVSITRADRLQHVHPVHLDVG